MKSPTLLKQALLGFVIVLLAYVGIFNWIEGRRHKKGPWEMSFTSLASNPAVVINQSKLGHTNITLIFMAAQLPARTNFPASIRFEQGRPVPFELPFGRCIFADTLFLPGTIVCELFGHEVQLLPRTLTIDRAEHAWQSNEKIFLTNRPSATLPAN